MNHVWIETRGDGRLLPAESPIIGANDRGLAYGDGLFETIRVRGGAPLFFWRHCARLRDGCTRLGFPTPTWNDATLLERCQRVIRENAVSGGVLRLTLTRGAGPRGFDPPSHAQTVLFVQAERTPDVLKTPGVSKAVFVPWKIDPASPLCSVKHISALDKVMARQIAKAAGADEAIFQNIHGHLTEGAASNLFVVVGNQILTPALHCGLLAGIARGLLIESANELPCPVVEAELPITILSEAAEAFFTNMVMGVCPLGMMDDRPIGSGGPGPITRGIQKLFEQIQNGGCNAC